MGSDGIAPPYLTATLKSGELSVSCTGRFTRGEIVPGAHLIGVWVGPRASLDVMEKRKISCPY
jgi:hypothetical protein